MKIIIQTPLKVRFFCRYTTNSVTGFLFRYYIFNCISFGIKFSAPCPLFLNPDWMKAEGDNTKGKN
jgi:hypothetical protein